VGAVGKLQHPDFTRALFGLRYRDDTGDGFANQVLVRFHFLLLSKHDCVMLLKPIVFSKHETGQKKTRALE
jgi:hypothetical protein